jgi:Raf kinase inhibitor-like YbhB/YbcL family protein
MRSFLLATAVLLAFSSGAYARDFTLSSPDIATGKAPESMVLAKSYGFGCDGANIAPALKWSDAPPGTKSFVLTLYDKDAPTGIGFMHWVVVNIPANQSEISASTPLAPAALQTRSDIGVPGFLGVCPPAGETHTYVFTLSALKVAALPVDANATPALVGFMTHANLLGQAKLTFTYGR